MKSHIVTGLIGAVVAVTAMLAAQPAEMSQASFPCVEDEVLGFAPQFGPDKVGCLSVEGIK